MKYIITEKQHALIKEFIVDEYSDETLFKIIDKLVVYIYGKELKMVENKDGYLRFFSSGPVSPFHRNLSGRLWVDDDRLEKNIEGFFGVDSEEAAALIAFYFSEKYGIKVTDARHQPHMGWFEEEYDYKQFDDPTYVVDDEDEDY